MKNLKFIGFSVVAMIFTVTNVFAKEVGTITEFEECISVDKNICTLNDNISVNDFTGARFTIDSGKTITIDLNGYTISGKNSNETVSSSIITNKGTLIINDSSSAKTGKIEMSDTEVKLYSYGYGMFVINNAGNLTINGGTLINNGKTDVPYAVDNNSTTNNVLLTVNGGNLIGRAAIRAFANSKNFTNDIIINNGHIEGSSAGIWLQQSNANANKATLTVNGGKIIGVGYPGVYADINNDECSSVVSMTFNGGEIRNNSETRQTIAFYPRSGESLSDAVINLTITDVLVINENSNGGVLSFDDYSELSVDNIHISGGKYSASLNPKYIKMPYVAKKDGEFYAIVLDKEEIITDSTKVDTKEEVTKVTIGVANDDKKAVDNVLFNSLEVNKNLITGANNSEEIEVKLEINPEIVPDDSKKLIKDSKKVKDLVIVDYFDANVNVYVEGEKVGNISELTDNIKLTIMLPTELQNVANGYTRSFYLVREHDGEISSLEAAVSEDGKYLSVETDKFSTYAIAYKDVKEVLPPQTGDNAIIYLIVGIIALLALASTGLFVKKRFN